MLRTYGVKRSAMTFNISRFVKLSSVAIVIAFSISGRTSAAPASKLCGGANCDMIVSDVASQLELLRGLNFTKPGAPVSAATPKAAESRAAKILDMYIPSSQNAAGLTAFYSQLGALPKGFDFGKAYAKAGKGLARSFYDSSDGSIFITEPGQTPGWNTPLIKKTMKTLSMSEEEFILTRELGFALIDQNFGLSGVLSGSPANSDAALAARALVDGDATMMLTDYLLRNTGANSLVLQDPTGVVSRFVSLVSRVDKKQTMSMPMAASARLTFPFVSGYNFVLKIRDTGGWPLVNAAYKSPPRSTEQVMHPEKYFTNRDVPISIVPPADAAPGGEYKKIFDDTLGEFGIKMLLQSYSGKKSVDAGKAAAGWGGDRAVAWKDNKSGSTIAALYTTWDSKDDAADFAGALDKMYPGANASSGAASIGAIGRDVILVHGGKPAQREKIMAAMWRSAKELPLFPPPQPAAVNPDSPFFEQQLLLSMLNDDKAKPAVDPEQWSVDGRAFTSRKNGFRLKAPNDNWRFQRFTIGRQVITEFTAFHKAYIGSEITLETYDKVLPGEDDPVDDMAYFISRQMGQFSTLHDKRIKVAGMKARETLYQGFLIVPIMVRYTEVFAPEKTYVFTCAASPPYFRKLQPEFDAFIASLELLKKPEITRKTK